LSTNYVTSTGMTTCWGGKRLEEAAIRWKNFD